MNTDAHYSGLRAKRCLPAKLHSKMPTPTYQESGIERTPALIRLKGSPSHAGQYHRFKARQLTLFYRLLPYLCRIGAPARPESGIDEAGTDLRITSQIIN
jgi:hypothetical protein